MPSYIQREEDPAMTRTVCFSVMIALLVALYHAKDPGAIAQAAEGVGDEEAWVSRGDPNQQCTDAHVSSLQAGGEALRNRVSSCAQLAAFGMAPTARELALRNIPVRFDQFNARPRGCVEMDMRVDEVRSGKVHRSWQVIVDVDNKTSTQNAHYGYTIAGLTPRVPKSSGHIFFPPTVFPPNVRPWLGESKGQIVHFADHKNGTTSNTVFKLSGKMYNQFHTKTTAANDDADVTANAEICTHGDDKGTTLRSTYII